MSVKICPRCSGVGKVPLPGISKRAWSKIRTGSILQSSGGVQRRVLRKRKGSDCVTFKKISLRGTKSDKTVYGYNDLCHKYKIVKL